MEEQATGLVDGQVIDGPMKAWLIANYKNKQLSRNSALYHIGQSLAGDLTVLDIKMKRLSTYIHGLMNDRIFLIGADSGVGKTTLADWMIISAILDAIKRGIPIKVRYYSWEISRAMKEAKLLSMFIYIMYGERFASDYLLGRMPEYLPSEKHLGYVMAAYKKIQIVMKHIEFIEPGYTASEIDEQIIHFVGQRGTIHRDGKGKIIGYDKDNPKSIEFVVYDHIALGDQETGEKTKDAIDSKSQNAVKHRNLFGLSSIFIQQFSTDLMSMNRGKMKSSDALVPQRLDFGDSKYTYRDADVVLGLIQPASFDVTEYFGYNIEQLGRYFIANHIMKNRYGDAGRMCPTFMDYIPGIPMDLPVPIGPEDVDIDDFLNLKDKIETCQQHYQRRE